MKVKLTFNDIEKTVKIPQKWEDVSYKDFVDIVKIKILELSIKDEIKQIIRIIYKLEDDEINSIDFDNILKLFSLIDFVNNFEIVLKKTEVPLIYQDYDIGSHEWSKLIEAMIYIKPIIEKYKEYNEHSDNMKNEFYIELLTKAPGFCKPYLGYDINDKSVIDVYWSVNFFLQKLVSFSMILENSKLRLKKKKEMKTMV